MDDIQTIIINKNRGWRGLAELVCKNSSGEVVNKMIFSFSDPVWRDLINRQSIVTQDEDNYYVIKFVDAAEKLPRPTQQRSVLIKNFKASVTYVNKYPKTSWTSAEGTDWNIIMNYLKNRNNHTTSDWNCIGIRVMPVI
jgi:hypothetical protein